MSGGPTVTLTFAGDADRLRRTLSELGKSSNKFSDDVSRTSGVAAVAFGGIAATAAGGALAAGAALAAVPLAFAAIGIAAAAQSEKVKSAFSGLKDNVVGQMKQLATPFEGVLVGIAGKAQATFNQIAPALGKIFADVAPMVDTLATAVMSLVAGAMPGFQAAIGAAKPVIDALAAGIAGLGPAITGFFTNLSSGSTGAAGAVGALFAAVNWLLPALGSVLGFLAQWSSVIVPIAAGVAAAAAAVWLINGALAVYNAVTTVVRAVTAAWAGVQWVLNAALLANPIGIIVIAIAALIAIIIVAWNNCATFRAIVTAAWEGIKAAFVAGVAAARGALQWFASLPGLIGGWFNSAVAVVAGAAAALVARVRAIPGQVMAGLAALGQLAGRFRAWFMAGVSAVTGAVGSMIGVVRSVPGRILGALGNLGGLLVGAGRALIQGLINGIKSAMSGAIAAVRNGMAAIRSFLPFSPAKEGPFSGRGYTLYSGKALIEDFGKGIKSAAPDLRGVTESALRGAQGALNDSVAVGSGRGGAGGSASGVTVTFQGNTSDALATVIMHLARTGKIQMQVT